VLRYGLVRPQDMLPVDVGRPGHTDSGQRNRQLKVTGRGNLKLLRASSTGQLDYQLCKEAPEVVLKLRFVMVVGMRNWRHNGHRAQQGTG
jgi:hypothetical protein